MTKEEMQEMQALKDAWTDDAFEQFIKRREMYMQLLMEGKEAEAASIIEMSGNDSSGWNSQLMLKMDIHLFKDNEIIYKLITNVYTNDGYRFPAKIIQIAKKIAPSISDAERYEDMTDANEVTVYRASRSLIGKVIREISWTTSLPVAIFFAYRYKDHDWAALMHIYKGTIKRDKIIKYTNVREEFEVMQYDNVRKIEEVFVTDEEVNAALKAHAEAANSHNATLQRMAQQFKGQ